MGFGNEFCVNVCDLGFLGFGVLLGLVLGFCPRVFPRVFGS